MNPKFNPNYRDPEATNTNSPTVGDSAQAAVKMLSAHPLINKTKGYLLEPENIQDAITDLLHLCDQEGVVGGEHLAYRAINMWLQERDPALEATPQNTREAIEAIVEGRTNPPGNLQID